MALVMCLFFRMSMFDEITDGIEYGESEYEDNSNDLFSSFANVYVDFNGNLKVNNYEEKQIKIQKFIPERDLSESDYKNYISDLKSKENKLVKLHSTRSTFARYYTNIILCKDDPFMFNCFSIIYFCEWLTSSTSIWINS